MCRAATLACCLLVLAVSRVFGQDVRADTVSDPFLVKRLGSELNWRRVARVYTADGGFEVRRPQVTLEGLVYEAAQGLGTGPMVSSLLPAPVPLSSIERIDVREGHSLLGLWAGAVVGGLVAKVLWESGKLEPSSSGSLSLMFVPLGAIAGFIVGESVTSWKPVYKRDGNAGRE